MKLLVLPDFLKAPDQGDGGIRRVVEAQYKYLPEYGIECTNNFEAADVVSVHAASWVDTDKPIVSHCHGLYWNEHPWPNWAIAMNKLVIDSLRKADLTTAPSEWVANVLRRGMWLDPVVLYHGIDSDTWLPQQSEGYVLWNKTRPDPICDPTYMDELAVRAPGTKFVTTFALGDRPNIEVLGKLPFERAKGYIEHAGVYLCTSRETFGIGTLEAMACGVPILGFNWGGQREFVQHKVHGYLANPYNYDDLREGLDYCLNNRKELGAAGRQLVIEQFTWPKVMEKYALTYKAAALTKKSGPKVSVVIPCYKLERYLRDCISSIYDQEGFDDYEIIVVNDASPTWGEVEAGLLDSPRIRVINNRENQYLAGALNIGIAAAKGKYIYPLDADNQIGERTLKTLSDALDQNRDLDIVYGRIKFVTESGDPDTSVSYDGISSWPPHQFDFNYQMMHRNQIPSSSMYRKTVWSRSGGYRSRCRTAEDADFWCRTTRLGFRAAHVTDAITLIYRNRNDSMSHTEKDWPWEAWYPESRSEKLIPFGVSGYHHNVSTYEPVLVSVVIPVGPGHNKIVIDAVDSVVAQTFQKWEVIVVNDTGQGSIQGLPPFVKVVNTLGREGPAKARNAGIAASVAHTFVLLDADDYLQPNALEEMYNCFKQFGGYVYSDWYAQESAIPNYCQDYDCAGVLQKMPHAVTALYPKAAWETVGGFDEKIEAWEDWDFIISLNAAGICGTRVPSPLFHYRLESGYRREQLYARQDDLKEVIRAKWRDYIDGGKQLMACGGCSGGGGGQYQPMSSALREIQNQQGDMRLLEYVGDAAEPRSWRGPTGTEYRFSNASDKIKFVRTQDIDHLINLGVFKIYEEAKPQQVLVASSPRNNMSGQEGGTGNGTAVTERDS